MFFRKFAILCLLVTPVLRFTVLPYYRRYKSLPKNLASKYLKYQQIATNAKMSKDTLHICLPYVSSDMLLAPHDFVFHIYHGTFLVALMTYGDFLFLRHSIKEFGEIWITYCRVQISSFHFSITITFHSENIFNFEKPF